MCQSQNGSCVRSYFPLLALAPLCPPFPPLGLFSFPLPSFGALFFPLYSPHVFLHATVHHFEDSLDATGPSHLLAGSLLGYYISYFSFFLFHTGFLVNTDQKRRRRGKNKACWNFILIENRTGTQIFSFISVAVKNKNTSLAEQFSLFQKCPQYWQQLLLSSWLAPSSSASRKAPQKTRIQHLIIPIQSP